MSSPPPFFASEDQESSTSSVGGDATADMTLEEEVEQLTKEEVRKMKRASNLRNANGVEYAPYVNNNLSCQCS